MPIDPTNACRSAAMSLLCLLLASCAVTKPWSNAPLQADERIHYNGRSQFADRSRAPDLLVIVSFSGGGSRAAAFAHAIMAELNSRPFIWNGQRTTLARETDMVAGVSGGSVAAAHVALHGVGEHLERFPAEFLAVDFQTRLVRAAVSPLNVYRMSSPSFGRGNLLAEEFDALLFGGATFGDLGRLPGRPYLLVGATDLSTGAEFDFASDQLSLLCTSIDHVPLAYAVAASSSVPLVFSPLSLQNHAPDCANAGVAAPLYSVSRRTARGRLVAEEFDSLALRERRFIHLVDGGLSDNLGLRRIADYVAQAGGVRPVLAQMQLGDAATLPRRIVFISVNAERRGPLDIDARAAVPTTLEVLHAMVYGGLGRYSRETSMLFSDAVEHWRRELRTTEAGRESSDIDIFSIDINFGDIDDAGLRDRVSAIPTAFRISAEEIAELRAAARRVVAGSSELQRFMASIPEHQ